MRKSNIIEKWSNCYVYEDGNKTIFVSYSSEVACKVNGKIYVTRDCEYSATTKKQLASHFNLPIAKIREGLKDGSIKMVNNFYNVD